MKTQSIEKTLMHRVLFVVAFLTATVIFGPTEGAHDDEHNQQYVCQGKQTCVTIYEHENQGGWHHCKTFEPENCISLKSWWTNNFPGFSKLDDFVICDHLHGGKRCAFDHSSSESTVDLKHMSLDNKTISITSLKRALCTISTNNGHTKKKADDVYEKCTPKDCSDVAACVTFYQHENFQGFAECQTIQQNECVTLNSRWIQDGSLVSSVDNHGNCVRLYDQVSCEGGFIELTAKHGSQKQLKGKNFDGRIKSVSSCERGKNVTLTDTKVCGDINPGVDICTTNVCSEKPICLATIGKKFGGLFQCQIFHDNSCIKLELDKKCTQSKSSCDIYFRPIHQHKREWEVPAETKCLTRKNLSVVSAATRGFSVITMWYFLLCTCLSQSWLVGCDRI